MTGIAKLASYLGVALCGASGIIRLLGHHYSFGFETTSFFILGIGLMVFSILVRLEPQAK